jgi:replication-associated recombination protein RarA
MTTYIKHSPKNFSEIVLPSSMKKWLIQCRKEGRLENMLFYGEPGLGKSLVASLLGTNVYMIHCDGDMSSADSLERAYVVARAMNLEDHSRRIIVFDEIDRWDRRFQEKVRALITTTGHLNVFIGTTNYLDKVIDGLQSRLMPICFDVDPADIRIRQMWQKRLSAVFQMETGETPPEEIISKAMRFYPDGRRMTTALFMPKFI